MKDQIRKLAKEKNAVILAHNYQPPEIQELADLCGDSLELSLRAAQTEAQVIVFCGVHFMAETASIVCPQKTVLLPKTDAGCPMADMVTPKGLAAEIKAHPGVPVVTYVNSSAAVKALSTICCTSANVLKVVDSLDAREIFMVPDRNLAQYADARTDKKVRFWEGFCPIHNNLTTEDVRGVQARHPEAEFMAHPECRPEILEMADVIVSTSGMIRHAAESERTEFIVGTEVGLIYPLQKASPAKTFHPAAETMICPDMKKIGLEDVMRSLETMEGEVKVPEEIRRPALSAVQRMLDLA